MPQSHEIDEDDVLVVRDLNVAFSQQRQRVSAVRNLSFSLRRGETLAIVGESGSGKSVTAMAIMRLLSARHSRTEGQVLLGGQSLLELPEEEMRRVRGAEVAMIFQEPMTSLNPVFTIGEQIAESIRLHQGLCHDEALREAKKMLERVRIPEAEAMLSRYPHQLSGGMRQRVMIAIAFSCEPDLLIADEPTTALDVTVQRQVLRLLKQKARATGTAVLFISHDMAVVSQVCDRLYVMYAGAVIESGNTGEVLQQPQHPYSIGLLNSAPDKGEPRTPLRSIPGTVPNLARLPAGCAFRERCFAAGEACGITPTLQAHDSAADRQAACWYPQRENAHV